MNQAESVSKNQNVSKIKSYRSSCLHIYIKCGIRKPVVVGVFLQNRLLVCNAVALALQIVIVAKAAVKRCNFVYHFTLTFRQNQRLMHYYCSTAAEFCQCRLRYNFQLVRDKSLDYIKHGFGGCGVELCGHNISRVANLVFSCKFVFHGEPPSKNITPFILLSPFYKIKSAH